MTESFTITTGAQTEFLDITDRIRKAVQAEGNGSGILCVFVPHTTAGVTINEGADPDVQRDMLNVLNEMVPSRFPYRHSEGNSPAHVKCSLIGSSVNVLVDGGRLVLGTWQSIFFCEFDGPRTRKVYWKLTKDRP